MGKQLSIDYFHQYNYYFEFLWFYHTKIVIECPHFVSDRRWIWYIFCIRMYFNRLNNLLLIYCQIKILNSSKIIISVLCFTAWPGPQDNPIFSCFEWKETYRKISSCILRLVTGKQIPRLLWLLLLYYVYSGTVIW